MVHHVPSTKRAMTSATWRKLLKPLQIILFLFLSVSLISDDVAAFTCDDIKWLDEAEAAGGTFLLWSGCEELSIASIEKRWGELPEVASFLHPNFAAWPVLPRLAPEGTVDRLLLSTSPALRSWALAILGGQQNHLYYWFRKAQDHKDTEEEIVWEEVSWGLATKIVFLDLVRYAAVFASGNILQSDAAANVVGILEPNSLLRFLDNSDVPLAQYFKEVLRRASALILPPRLSKGCRFQVTLIIHIHSPNLYR